MPNNQKIEAQAYAKATFDEVANKYDEIPLWMGMWS